MPVVLFVQEIVRTYLLPCVAMSTVSVRICFVVSAVSYAHFPALCCLYLYTMHALTMLVVVLSSTAGKEKSIYCRFSHLRRSSFSIFLSLNSVTFVVHVCCKLHVVKNWISFQ